MKKASILLFTMFTAAVVNYYSLAQTKKPAAKGAAKTTSAKAKGAVAKGFSPAEIEEGKNLLAKSDCLACHKLDVRVVGPAYKAVAEKYPPTEASVSKLSEKIIKGGAGVWGQVPMTPHPAISTADAGKMVKYILSVK
ncbi:MAG TPA: c-type cytochrome [Segetibacter sp.]